MRQSHAIAERGTLKGQAVGSGEASQQDSPAWPTQTVFSCWGMGEDGHLKEFWCKTRPNQECRATCPLWSDHAA
jgi:hypothetical protein